MKKVLALFLILALTLTSAAAWAEISLTKEEKTWIRQHPELEVGAFTSYPPFGFEDDKNQAAGMSADFWKILAEIIGVRVNLKPTQFAEQIQGMKDGKFDSLAGIFPLESRKAFLDFSKPYFVIKTYIYVQPKYKDKVKGFADLKGLKVAAVKGDSGQTLAEQAGLTVMPVETYTDGVLLVAAKAVDAIVMDSLVVAYLIVQNRLEGRVVRVGEPVDVGQMCLPVKKGNLVLLGILDKGIEAFPPEKLENIARKWLEF